MLSIVLPFSKLMLSTVPLKRVVASMPLPSESEATTLNV